MYQEFPLYPSYEAELADRQIAPWIGEGQEKYENGRRYVLTNGQWVDYGPATVPTMPVDLTTGGGGGDFTSMGDRLGLNPNPVSNILMPTEEPSLTQTGPKEGDTQSIGGITLRFTNGRWVEQGTTNGGLGGTNMPYVPEDWGREFAAREPMAAWMKAFGLPALGQNPYQQWLASKAAPAYATYLGTQFAPGATAQDFTPSYGNWGQTASSLLGQARGWGAPAQEEWISDIGGVDSLSNLLEQALGYGGRGFAGPIAARMANKVPALQQGWKAETGAGATGGTFLEYLRQKYGL